MSGSGTSQPGRRDDHASNQHAGEGHGGRDDEVPAPVQDGNIGLAETDAGIDSGALPLPDLDDLDEHRRLKNLLREKLFGGGNPETIARFEVRRQLGAGGMGVVYGAYDRELEREVAIKLIRSTQGELATVERRLMREAQTMARLSHPNVVPIYEVGRHGGRIFVAMELVAGETLRNWQTRADRSWREIVGMYIQAGRGLAAAHAEGIIHRDFKPDNVLVGRDGRARVVDFGLAQAAYLGNDGDQVRDESASSERGDGDGDGDGSIDIDSQTMIERITRTGAMMGTVAYMAPEQFALTKTDARTDQFSFCIALYEALYGTRPFRGDSIADIAAAVTTGRWTRPSTRTKLPAWLKSALARGLAIRPEDRFADMGALLTLLARYSSRRRLIAWAGVAVLALGAGAGLILGMQAQPDATVPCRGIDTLLGDTWNRDSAQSLATGFAATGLSYASTVWSSVAAEIDDYVADWQHTRQAGCEAALVEKHHSEALYDLQIACLERPKLALTALVARFESPDSDTVEHAYSAVISLPEIAACSDVELLRLGMPPPADGDTQAGVDTLRTRLATVASLRQAGKYRRALSDIEPIVAVAEGLGYQPIAAEALFERGHLQGHLGAGSAAIDTLLEAVDRAEASRHDQLAARIWSRLIAVAAKHTKEPARAQRWFRRARAAIERMGIDREGNQSQYQPLLAEALEGLGLAHYTADDYDAAETAYRQALALRTQRFGNDHILVANSLDNLGTVLGTRRDYHAAFELYQHALAIRIRVLGAKHPHVAQQRYNLGWLCERMGDFSCGREHYQYALAIYRDRYGNMSTRTADVLLALAQLYEGQGAAEVERTEAYVREAVYIYEQALPNNHPTRSQARNLLATVLFHQRRYDEALSAYRELLTEYQASAQAEATPRTIDIAIVRTNIGETLLSLKRPGDALPDLSAAANSFAAKLGPRDPYLAHAEMLRGRVLAELGRHHEAIELFEQVVAIYREHPGMATEHAAAETALADARTNARR